MSEIQQSTVSVAIYFQATSETRLRTPAVVYCVGGAFISLLFARLDGHNLRVTTEDADLQGLKSVFIMYIRPASIVQMIDAIIIFVSLN